jgi:uncharacterized protein
MDFHPESPSFGTKFKFFSTSCFPSVKFPPMASNLDKWRMSLPFAAAIWCFVVMVAALYGISMGYSGPKFAIGLGVAGALFAFELSLATPAALALLCPAGGRRGARAIVLLPLLTVLTYSLGVTGHWKGTLLAVLYAILPLVLGIASQGKPAGTLGDYLSLLIIWLPVEFRWMYRLFVFPSSHGTGIWPLTHTLTILFALSTGVAAFVLVRQLEGIGYAVEWKRSDGLLAASHFLLFALIAVPLGLWMRFLTYDPSASRLRSLPLSAIGILLFTAWPEEFLFRGLLQNLLAKTIKNRWAGLMMASAIFGLSHILHAPVPNWKYVALATVAGIFYGHAWMKSGSLLPGAIVHGLVDVSWHVLFR